MGRCEAERIDKKIKGKTLVWLGNIHVPLDSKPFRTTRTHLEASGKRTAGIVIEIRASYNLLVSIASRSNGPWFSPAVRIFFGRSINPPKKPIAYPTSEMEKIVCLDASTPEDEPLMFYKSAYDMVIFSPDKYTQFIR